MQGFVQIPLPLPPSTHIHTHSKLLSLQPYIGIGIFVFLAKPICIVSLSLPLCRHYAVPITLYRLISSFSLPFFALFSIPQMIDPYYDFFTSIFVFYSIPFRFLLHFPYFHRFFFVVLPFIFLLCVQCLCSAAFGKTNATIKTCWELRFREEKAKMIHL